MVVLNGPFSFWSTLWSSACRIAHFLNTGPQFSCRKWSDNHINNLTKSRVSRHNVVISKNVKFSIWFIFIIKLITTLDDFHYVEGRDVEHDTRPCGKAREWASLGIDPLSWLLINKLLGKVNFDKLLHISPNCLLVSNQDKRIYPKSCLFSCSSI